MNVMDKLTEAIDILNEVDEYAATLNNRLSVLDSKEQDLLHYIENNDLRNEINNKVADYEKQAKPLEETCKYIIKILGALAPFIFF